MKKILLCVLSLSIGSSLFAQTDLINEDFTTGTGTTPPANWTNNDILPGGDLWSFDNPGFRALNAPISNPAAILDSDAAGANGAEETALETPSFDASGFGGTGFVFLEFDHYFQSGFGGDFEVEVFNATAGTWTSVLSAPGASTPNPEHQMIDITAAVAFDADAQVRFRWIGSYSWFWILDNVHIHHTPCISPTDDLSVTSFNNDSISVDWTVGTGGETAWQVNYGESPFDPDAAGTILDVTAASDTTIGGLTQLTNYDIYVRANCGADQSGWIGPVNQTTSPTCANPSGLTLGYSVQDTAEVTWTANGSESMWNLQFGFGGFDIASNGGTIAAAGQTTDTIFNMAANGTYDVYVQANCGGTDTSEWVGPLTFDTYDLNEFSFMESDAQCSAAGYVDISATGTEVIGLTDDGDVTGIALPFPVLFQGAWFNNFGVDNNGGIILGNGFPDVYGNAASKGDGNLTLWGDDLDTESGGVYYEAIGTAPNRTFILQFHDRNNFPGGLGEPTISAQIQIEEGTWDIYYIYDDVEFGGTQTDNDFAAEADITMSGPNTDIDISNSDVTYLTNNTCAHFYYIPCPAPNNLMVTEFNNDSIVVTWNEVGFASAWETNYGPEGFDPDAAGTTASRDALNDTLDVLTQLTTYDIYVRSDCGAETSGWFGPITQMTAPNCANPSGLTEGYVAEDSIEVMFTDNAGAANWNLQYGLTGFEIGSGTTQALTTTTDSILDPSLMGSTVYDVYVQADCGTLGDTSQWIGPLVVAMPIANDSTCDAIAINVDGSVNVFNNTGATTQMLEAASIQPTINGFSTQDGWGEAGMNLSTWFTFDAPATGIVEISTLDEDYPGQIAVYEATDCSDFSTFTFLGANDDGYDGFTSGSELTICGLTPGNTYYLVHDENSWSGGAGNYSIKISEVTQPEAGNGTDVLLCAGTGLDLNTMISGNDDGGTWTFVQTDDQTFIDDDSLFLYSGILAYTDYEFEYTVNQRCAMDSVVVTVTTVGPSNAGVDTTILEGCFHSSVNLFDGLSGALDLGGTWYDAVGTALPGNTVVDNSISIAGAYNYTYVVSNGACPNDTSEITVVFSDCVGLDSYELGDVSIYPNPTNGIVNIANNGNAADFEVSIEDIRGKVIYNNSSNMAAGSIETVDLTNYNKGIYFVSVTSQGRSNQYKVVLQ